MHLFTYLCNSHEAHGQPYAIYYHVIGVWLSCGEYRDDRHLLEDGTRDWCCLEPRYRHSSFLSLSTIQLRYMEMSHLHKVTAGCTCCFISCCAYGCTHFTHMHRKSTEVVVQSQNEVPALVPFCIFPHFSILLKLPLLFYPELMKKLLQISLLTQNIHNFGVAEVFYSAGFFFPSQKQNF